MSTSEESSPEREHRFHHYSSNDIPWYVRLIWILFWVFTIYYMIRYCFPAIQIEMISPP